MKHMKVTQRTFLLMIVLILLQGQLALAQTNRIWYIAVVGASLGWLVAVLWLPRLSSLPHKDDNSRARGQFYIALILSIIGLAIYLIIDASFIYRFGRQTYTFWEAFLQVWLTWQTFVMLLLAALLFTLVVALWTRFVSNKPYRYMLISR
jgi:hypothetical protein